MTVITFDGKSICADKRNTWGTGTLTTTKLVPLHGGVLAGCGNTSQIIELLHWVRKGAKPSTFPPSQRDPECAVSLLHITSQGQILQYENTPHPIIIENDFWAIGSGADYAMAAMYLGRSAREAAEVACALDPGCGNGIDEMVLFPEADA